jgi:hypothetical protein
LLHALVTAADDQDRDGGILLLSTLFGQFPFLRKLFADSAYAGPIFQHGVANAMPDLMIEIVRRSYHAKGFVVEPLRWIVSGPLASSVAVAGLPRIGRTATTTPSPSSASPPSASCSESSAILHEVFGQMG